MDEPMESSFDPGIDGLHRDSLTSTTSEENQNAALPIQSATISSVCVNLTQNITVSESNNKDVSVSKPHAYFAPLLRPGIMVMMTLTEEDYETQYWPKLRTAIDQLLNMKHGAYIPISYEQMYSCVYKCVCKQFSERLYNDLLNHLCSHMDYLNSELKIHEGKTIPYIETFSSLMHQYLQALSGIVPIFNYMNRFYVENKLKKDLNEELRKLFRSRVIDVHINALIKLLDEASSVPFAISPPIMASIMKNLYALNEEYSKLNPLLFSRFLPSILPPTDPALLEHYAQEAHYLQKHLASTNDCSSHNTSRKRVYEDDISVN
uniref:Cullin N-terminal domain-containing protein n=1 Tax=Arion vulgaris TaxID=1028688 RepID=A0A0B6ZYN5_9EUPU